MFMESYDLDIIESMRLNYYDLPYYGCALKRNLSVHNHILKILKT